MIKRILFVLHLPPPLHGASMMGAFVRDSKLLADSFDRRFINLSTSAALQEIGHFSVGKILVFLRLLRDIRRTLRKWHPDLVYLTPTSRFPGFIKDYLVAQLCKLHGAPLILHFHNTGVSLARKGYQRRMYRRFFRDTRVILLSERLYPDISAYVPRERVDICPNGLPDLFKDGLPKREDRDVPCLLFLSNLLIAKGIFVFLDACRMLRSHGVPFTARIVGGETTDLDAGQLAIAISERGLDNVSYLGRLVGEDKRRVLETSDMLVFPSLDEAFGLVLLEAQQACIPVVASRIGGIPDVVSDGEDGMLVTPGSVSELVETLEALLADPSLRVWMGENGRRSWEAHFSLQVFEQRMQRILTEAVRS